MFHPHVIEVKKELELLEENRSEISSDGVTETSPDKRLLIIRKLTEPTPPQETVNFSTESQQHLYIEDYERMWEKVFTLKRDQSNANSKKWVYKFIDDVKYASNLPEYLTLSKKDRDHKLSKTANCVKFLKDVYINNYKDEDLLHGFKEYDEDGSVINSSITLDTLLDGLYDTFKLDLEEYFTKKGNTSKGVEIRNFIGRIKSRNKQFSLMVLQVLTYAIYQKYYEESNISKILRKY